MAKQPVPCRLEPELVALLNAEAEAAKIKPATHVAAIIEAHIRRNGNGRAAPSEDLLRRHDEILQVLRTLSQNTESRLLALSKEIGILNRIVGQKETEADGENTELRMRIDQVRSDIATLFGAALQSFAGVERDDAIAFTQKYMYPANGRA